MISLFNIWLVCSGDSSCGQCPVPGITVSERTQSMVLLHRCASDNGSQGSFSPQIRSTGMQVLHQLRGKIVVEQVDEAEGFSRSIALGGVVEQVDQLIVDGATGVGLLQHFADYARPCCSRNGAVLSHRCRTIFSIKAISRLLTFCHPSMLSDRQYHPGSFPSSCAARRA